MHIPTSGPMSKPKDTQQAFDQMVETRFENTDEERESREITYETEELTAVCPKTRQPDYYKLTIRYSKSRYFLESKALKLYLWSFREVGMYAEDLSSHIGRSIKQATQSENVVVTLVQNKRGGLGLTSEFTAS